jgi:hypothetical protein
MNEKSKDRLRELMVAALYGEIGDEERAELEKRIEGDDELRAEWEELLETRSMLGVLDEGREVLGAPDIGQIEAMALGTGTDDPRFWSRSRRSTVLAASSGFALAASLFVCLLVVGLRIDTSGPGLRVSFGGDEVKPPQSELTPYNALAALEMDARYMTREEFAAFAQLLLDTTAARFDQFERRNTEIQTASTSALYDALAFSQQRQFDDLRVRLELATRYGAFELTGADLDRIPVRNTPGGQQQ